MFVRRACLQSSGGIDGARIIFGRSPLFPSSLVPGKLLLPRWLPSPPPIASPTTSAPPSFPSVARPFATSIGVRSFSSSGSGGDDGEDASDRDILLSDEESLPAPPSYVRDAVTGKWTDRTKAQLSPEDRRLLKLADEEKSEATIDRLGQRWEKASLDAESTADGDERGDVFGSPNQEHERVARRIEEQRLALGEVGRDPAGGLPRGREGGNGEDGAGEGRPLTPRELRALKAYAQEEHGVHPRDFARSAEGDDTDLIPHQIISSGSEGAADSKYFDPDLDLAYLNPRLSRKAFREEGGAGRDDFDPFADLLPSDLNPAQKVNRRRAKPIPRKLIHHNNLSLLRRYTTPGGKIMNRVQSRLGARDQRKISKLVKRARNLGLIPHLGQWKFEDHGYLHEPGLDASCSDDAKLGEACEGKRDWEVELERRGLWPLQDEAAMFKKFYDIEGMLNHIAGPRGSKKRDKIERLIGGEVVRAEGLGNKGTGGK